MTSENKTLNITEIQALLPHRYPFLMVDRVVNYEEGKTLTAIKNVSVNEPQFTGHFPKMPVFPGVLILEAMAQATGLLAFKTFGAPAEMNCITLPALIMRNSVNPLALVTSW